MAGWDDIPDEKKWDVIPNIPQGNLEHPQSFYGFPTKTVGTMGQPSLWGLPLPPAKGGTSPIEGPWGNLDPTAMLPLSSPMPGIGNVGMGIGEKTTGVIKKIFGGGKGKTAESLLQKVGGEMKPSMAGESAQEWMQIGSQEAKEMGDQFYSNMLKEAKDVKINQYPNTWETIDKIKSGRNYKMLNLQDRKHIDTIIDQIKAETSTRVKAGKPRQFTPEQQADLEKQVVGQYGIPAPPENSFESAIGLKRSLADQVWETKGTSKGRLIRDLKDAIFDDMELASKQANRSDLMQSLKDADRFWSENVFGEGKGGLIARYQNMSSEKLVDKLRTGSIKDIQAIKDTTGTNGFQDLKQGYVTDLIDRNENNAIRIAKEVRGSLAKRSEELSQIFDADELEILKNIGNPSKMKIFLEGHPKTAWIARILTRAGIYVGAGALGYRLLRPGSVWGEERPQGWLDKIKMSGSMP